MEIRHFISKVANLVWAQGNPAYEAGSVGTGTIVKVFATLTSFSNYGTRQVVNICNTHASQDLYVFWVPRGHATLVGGSDFTAAKCKKIIPAKGDAQLAFNADVDIYLLASGASTTYTAEEMA